jgi:DNA-binding SARP family transcriptional activator
MRKPRRGSVIRRTASAEKERTFEDGALRRSALQLLHMGDYEHLAELMRQADSRASGPPSGVSAEILHAARWMSESCIEGRAEAARHRDALAQLTRREDELTGKLEEIVSLVGAEQALIDAESSAPESHHEPRHVAEVAVEGGGSTANSLPIISVHCLGQFQAYFKEQLVENWPNGRGRAIFKFLIARRDHTARKEVLMEQFWPDAEPDAARNNLNVSIYSVRQAFARIDRSYSVILFQDDFYSINPQLSIWVDYERFLDHVRTAGALQRRSEMALAAYEYRRAEALYRGDFLEEDRYEDWVEPVRTTLRDDYLTVLDRLAQYSFDQGDYGGATGLSGRVLEVDPCDERAHQRLMHCWSQQGLPHLALRQYHVCRETLARELHLPPSEVTRNLFETIRRRKPF